MKTISLTLILFAILTTSFSGKDLSSRPGITATIDSVSYTFKIRDTAYLSTIVAPKGTFYSFIISGQTEEYKNYKKYGGKGYTINIGITRKNKKIIVDSTYYNYDSTIIEDGRSYIGYIDFSQNAVYGSVRNRQPPTISKVTITSIDSTSVQGTFSGEVVLTMGGYSLKNRLIINGNFDVPLVRK